MSLIHEQSDMRCTDGDENLKKMELVETAVLFFLHVLAITPENETRDQESTTVVRRFIFQMLLSKRCVGITSEPVWFR